jgi:flagella basal body P-ring formation protein FlgA
VRWIIALFFVHAAFASSAQTLMERLIADAWLPNQVRVEWTFSGPIPLQLEQSDEWSLTDPRPSHLAGSMNLKLKRTPPNKQTEQVLVSGRACIFGPSYTVKQSVPSGNQVYRSNVDRKELEWTLLSSPPITVSSFPESQVAVKMLIPGRPLSLNDIKPAPIVKRGQRVNLEYQNGTVKLTMIGRALLDGADGETIPVAVDLGKEKRFQGKVQASGLIQLIL